MKKQERIRILAREYFWKQKGKEVGMTILVLLSLFTFYFLSYDVGSLFFKGESYEIAFGGFFVLVGLALIICMIWCWIENNLEKARDKAEYEIK